MVNDNGPAPQPIYDATAKQYGNATHNFNSFSQKYGNPQTYRSLALAKFRKDRFEKQKQTLSQNKMVLQVPCPVCDTPVPLLCPNCKKGALYCEEDGSLLRCEHCYNVVKAVFCHEGHRLNMAYIYHKQKRHYELKNKSQTNLWVILGAFGLFGLGISFVVSVLAYFGNY